MTDRYLISYNNVNKSIEAQKYELKKEYFYIKMTHLQVKKTYFLLEMNHCNMEMIYFLLEISHCNMEIEYFLALFKFFYLLFSHYFIQNIFFNKQRALVGCTCKKKDLISFVFSC